MSSSKLSLAAIGIALMAPALTQAACQASIASIPDPTLDQPIDTSHLGGYIGPKQPASARSTTQAYDSYSEGGPSVVVIPSSVQPAADPGCASDTFGAPLAAQGLQQMRLQMARTQHRLAQRRAEGTGTSGANNRIQMYASGGDQSRREGGDSADGSQALRISRADITIGADYRINDQWATGLAIGLGNPRLRWDGSTSRVDGQSGNITGYANWSPTASSYVALALSIDSTHYDLHASDDNEYLSTGVNTGLSLSAGYDWAMGSWTLSPYTRVDEVASRIGSFGGDGERTRARSGAVSAGTQVQTTIPTSWGLIAPHARVEFTQVTGWHIRGSSASTYVAGQGLLPGPNPIAQDRQYGQLGAGASLILQGGLTLFTDYETGFAQRDVSNWRLSVGIRHEL